MSAMPALDWPEDEPASWPAATWTVPAQPARAEPARHHTPRDQGTPDQVVRAEAVPGQAVRGQVPRAQAVPGRAVRGQVPRGEVPRAQALRARAVRAQAVSHLAVREHTVRSQAVHGHAPHGAAAPAPLRLTRRGRIVVAGTAALLVALLSVLVTGGAWATSHSAPSRGADRSLTQVVVLPGQSLWSVAQTADPNADPRQVMQQIIDLNGLAGDVIMAGQRLWVPRG
jgi:hypothetical protein